MTPPPEKRKSEDSVSAKYELNLAEFPVTLLSQSVPEGKEKIVYSDEIMVNGKTVERTWTVTGRSDHGLPTGSALDVLFEIINLWKEQGFKRKRIHIGGRYRLLQRMGSSTSARDYERLERILETLHGVHVECEQAWWDADTKKLESESFYLFPKMYTLKENPEDGQRRLPFGWIEADPILHEAVQNGNLLTINAQFFRELTSPVQKRLALYLTKMLRRQRKHRRDLMKLAEQLPVSGEYPSHIKQTLNRALDGLLDEGFDLLADYHYEESSGGGENIVFVKGRAPSESLNEEAQQEVLVEDMIDALGDEKSRGFYELVAKRCPPDMIYRALSETTHDYSPEDIQASRGAIFTDKIKRYAEQRGINLGLGL